MNSLATFVQSIHLFRIKTSKRYKNQNSPFDIPQRLAQVSKIAICPPDDPSEVETAYKIVPKLQSCFNNCQVTIIIDESCALPHIDLSGIKVLTFSAEDLSRYKMPKKQFQQKLSIISCDMVIDLSLPYNFTNAVIAWTVGAQMRVGFYHPNREDMYNFLLRHKAGRAPEEAYQSLINYLVSDPEDNAPH